MIGSVDLRARCELLKLGVLGQVRATRGDEVRPIRGKRRLVLLAMLGLHGVLSRDRLIEAIWAGQLPANPTHALEALVSQVRSSLGEEGEPVIELEGDAYRLSMPTDVSEFERLVADARASATSGDERRAGRVLRQALDLWRGPVADGVDLPPDARPEVARLDELRLAVTEEWIDAQLASGSHTAVVDELQRLVAVHPWRERLRGQLMLALYRSGRQADALRAYQHARDVLGEELGIEPTRDLRELEALILLQDPEIDPTTPADLDHGEVHLPAALSSFVGRKQELAALQALLEESRLVTIVGPAGVGKTRLATEVARRAAQGVVGGTWFVDLTQAAEESEVISTLRGALGLAEHAPAPDDAAPLEDVVHSFVAARQPLLVIDNCEHVIGEAARVCSWLLDAGDRVRVVATSREALRIPGERVWEAPSMVLPNDGDTESILVADAVRLFIDRASAANAGFTANAETARTIAEVCRRLDGIALAIELAASRADVFGPSELLVRLDDRLSLLEDGYRTATPRQQTLRAAIDWSYALLSAEERALWRRLGIFSGTFDLAAVEALGGDGAARTLADLVRKSIVQRRPGRKGRHRYRLLETMREYAVGLIDEADEQLDLATAHARYYHGRAEDGWAVFETMKQVDATEELSLDLANLRAALGWFEEHDVEALLEMAGALGWLWDRLGLPADGSEWLHRALRAARPVEGPGRARALWASALLTLSAAKEAREVGYRNGIEALAMYERLGDGAGRARAWLVLARQEIDLVGVAGARHDFQTASDLYRQFGTRWGLAQALHFEAHGIMYSDTERARDRKLESASLFDEVGDSVGWAASTVGAYQMSGWYTRPHGASPGQTQRPGIESEEWERVERALLVLEQAGGLLAGHAAWVKAEDAGRRFTETKNPDDFREARKHGERAVRIFDEHHGTGSYDPAVTAGNFGWLFVHANDYRVAMKWFREAMRRSQERGLDGMRLYMIESIMAVCAEVGHDLLGAQLAGAAATVRDEQGWPMPAWDVRRHETYLDRIRKSLGTRAMKAAMAEGSTWSLDQAADAATALELG